MKRPWKKRRADVSTSSFYDAWSLYSSKTGIKPVFATVSITDTDGEYTWTDDFIVCKNYAEFPKVDPLEASVPKAEKVVNNCLSNCEIEQVIELVDGGISINDAVYQIKHTGEIDDIAGGGYSKVD